MHKVMPMNAEIGRKQEERKNPPGIIDPRQWTRPSQSQL